MRGFMKNHILLFFGFACVGTYAVDITEHTVLANIPYYHHASSIFTERPLGHITLEVTPTLTLQDLKNEAEHTAGPVFLLYTVGGLKMPVNLRNTLPIATIYKKIGDTTEETKNKLKDFIEKSFAFVLKTK
jgi:hypothetical protein